MPTTENSVEEIYRARIGALAPRERVERMAAMAQWARNQIRRQIMNSKPDISPEELKWRLALRLYGNEPALRDIIEQKLDDVSR